MSDRLAAFLSAWLVCLSGAALGQSGPPSRELGRISVVGRAQVETQPDYASVQIGVVTRGATASVALGDNSAAAGKVIALARQQGVEAADIGTGAIALTQAFKNVRGPGGQLEQQPDGYQAQNSVTIRLADMAKLGELIRQAVDGGANRIDGVSFGLKDTGKVERQAGAAATRDALEQARAITDAAGVSLGPIESIAYPARADRPTLHMPELRMAASGSSKAVPVEAGTLSALAEIEIVWLLKQP